MEQFFFIKCRESKTKVINLAHHKGRKKSVEQPKLKKKKYK